MAPLVMRTCVFQSRASPVYRSLCAANACRTSGRPAMGGYWLLPSIVNLQFGKYEGWELPCAALCVSGRHTFVAWTSNERSTPSGAV